MAAASIALSVVLVSALQMEEFTAQKAVNLAERRAVEAANQDTGAEAPAVEPAPRPIEPSGVSPSRLRSYRLAATWLGAWSTVLMAMLIWRALRLRADLSEPLSELAQAAWQVSRGDFSTAMPNGSGVFEIARLRQAVETMRQRLVESLSDRVSRNEELLTILKTMNDGVVLLDGEGRIREFNPVVATLWRAAGSPGRPPATDARFDQVFPMVPPEALHGLESEAFEVTVNADSRPPRVYRFRENPIQETIGHRNPGRVLVLQDVSREREAEAAQRNFLSVVTHELKTPLTAILGYTRLMLKGKGGELNERHRPMVETVDAQATRLLEMIQDLLDITRIEGGNLPFDRSPTRLRDLLAEAERANAGAAQARNLTLDVRLPEPDSPADALVQVDGRRMGQVLGNLIGNAFKFTEPGGRITVTAGRDGDSAAWFAVEDTGRGIPPSDLPRLFTRFYQVDRSDTRNQGGAGLGLYICRELVRAHGGQISVTSRLGEGSRFQVSLPVLPRSEAP